MPRPNWIRPAMMPQRAREIERGALYSELCQQISDAYGGEGLLSHKVARIRATRLPVLGPMTWIEALVQTELGPAQASFALTTPVAPLDEMDLYTGGMRVLDGDLALLSRHAKPQFTGLEGLDDWVDYARVFCGMIREARAVFELCASFEDLCAYTPLTGRQKARLRAVFVPPRVEPVCDIGSNLAPLNAHGLAARPAARVGEVMIAYGRRLARARLRLHENCRLEMLADVEIARLPPPRYAAGPKKWMYKRSHLAVRG